MCITYQFWFILYILFLYLSYAHELKLLTTEEVPPVEIHGRMQAVYGDQCVDVSTVRCWVRRFKDGELGQADLSDKQELEGL